MDAALSASVSSLRPLPFLSPNPNPTKEPPLNHQLLLLLRPSLPPQTPSSILSLPSFPTLAPKPRPPPPPPPPPPTSTLPSASAHGPVHRRAATGYAAALADAALCAGALGPAARCARRLALRAGRSLADPAAAAAAAEGGLERHVAAMVRLLVGKGRAGMVAEVVAEFVRICDELGATETVVMVVEKEGRRRRRRVKRISEEAEVRPRHLFAV